ncbi:MAG: hypothetical protein DMF99_18195 [Acidobacteria bacterium]|nr:MAG: hypothetical protein DMF99_18195 [Acidobacteriota bacterium]
MPFSLYVFDLDGTLVDSRRDLAESANELLRVSGAWPLPEEDIGRMVDGRLLNHTRPYSGIRETLDRLIERAPLAVLTNKPIAATRRILAGLQLNGYFDASFVIGGDGPFPRKPDPSALRHLAAIAATTVASTLLIGDSLIDWRTARQAGTAFCLARYGFGFGGIPRDALSPDDCIVDDPLALLAM